MLKQLAASVLLGSLSLSALAEVVVKAPEEIIVVAINDQEVRNSLFAGKNKVYKLDDGQHTISVQYKQLFNPLYTTHEIVKSGIVTLNTGVLTDGQYELVLVNPPQDVDAAKEFAEQPAIGLKNAQGQIVAQQSGASSKAKPWFGGGIFGSVLDLRKDKDDEVQTYRAAPSVQTVAPVQATIQTTASPVQDIKTATPLSGLSKDQQLIELWKNATPQERQKFTAWLGGQATQ